MSGARGKFPIEISIHFDRRSIQIYGQKMDLRVLNIFFYQNLSNLSSREYNQPIKFNQNFKEKINLIILNKNSVSSHTHTHTHTHTRARAQAKNLLPSTLRELQNVLENIQRHLTKSNR